MTKLCGTLLMIFGVFGMILHYWIFQYMRFAVIKSPAEVLFDNGVWIYVICGAMVILGAFLIFQKK